MHFHHNFRKKGFKKNWVHVSCVLMKKSMELSYSDRNLHRLESSYFQFNTPFVLPCTMQFGMRFEKCELHFKILSGSFDHFCINIAIQVD